MKEVRSPNTTLEQDYTLPLSLFKIILAGSFLVSLAFYYTFPVEKIFHHYIATILKTNPQCQLQFKNYEFGLFMPNLQFNEVAIPERCIDPGQKTFIIDEMKVGFGGLNFSPLGIVANLNLKIGENKIELKASSDGNEHVIKISDQVLKLGPLSELLNKKLGMTVPSLKGKADLNLHLKTLSNRIEIFDLKINSKDFELPTQSMMGLLIPELNFEILDITAKGKGKQILIEKLVAGTNVSPLYLKTDGSIALEEQNIANSEMDLNVHLRFSKQLLEQYSIFKMMLAQFDVGDNNYKLKLTGNMSRPQTMPVK